MGCNDWCLNSDQPIAKGYCGTDGIGNGFWGAEFHPKGFSDSIFEFRFCSCSFGMLGILVSRGEISSEALVSRV